jgi:hypothetical protein
LAIYSLPTDFVLTLIVPIFNKCETIGGLIGRLRATGIPMQIVLVDDGSTDGTGNVVDKLSSAADINVIHHSSNVGKGAAIRSEHFEAILSDLKESRFGIEIELTARWARRGLRFTERPIRYQHRWYDAGKKIGWRDGTSALRCIAKYGLVRR